MEGLIERTKEFVRAELEGNDASHDFYHIERVWKLAKTLAEREGVEAGSTSLLIVELAALLHDIKDWKYSGDEKAGVEAAKSFLLQENVDAEVVDKVAQVIDGVSFKNELGRPLEAASIPIELAIVQDADRLDAIGAIGICRTFAYGASRGTPFYDPDVPPRSGVLTKEAYMATDHSQASTKNNNNNDEKKTRSLPKTTTINHFYEKLLKLKDMMKTESGKRIAEGRHQFMEQFLSQFYLEHDAKA
ncbi:HD domain-containing protein [Balamuthia mandrillaris]